MHFIPPPPRPLTNVPPFLPYQLHHHHHQSLFIHEIVSFYIVFLGIVCKIILNYTKKLLDYKVKNTKTYIIMIRVTMSHSS